MSYPWFGTGSDFNYCFMYMSQLTKCHQNKLYPKTRCQNELQDFIECHNRQKHRASFRKATNAIISTPNINVPHYHEQTDTFVYDNGKVIANNDPIFKEYKWF